MSCLDLCPYRLLDIEELIMQSHITALHQCRVISCIYWVVMVSGEPTVGVFVLSIFLLIKTSPFAKTNIMIEKSIVSMTVQVYF